MTTRDKIGISFLIIGFLIPFFIYFGFIIGLPIYVIGIIILLFGNLKIKQKLLWILIPAILFIPVSKTYSSISFYFADIQKFDIILPENFKGTAIIIDNSDFGQTFEKKHRREQIIFDENGIAFYPSELELDRSKFRVFLKQKNGELKKVLLSSETSEKTTLLAYGESSFKKTIESAIKYIPYDFVRIGENFTEQSNSEKRDELIKLIKKGQLKTVYNNVYK
ncbi:hypothetical protein [Polaribacter sp. MED152]|uniref:hypothetical protein n=1 Tax=Polaribacter sp. MED152 TaxID=313598 RepID=UPI000068CA0B|nr:hypothetical protein [Polaribacter sp. MED152]EAQ41241.1 hypothetical protein MED152_00965 [Polaribacter sp. MED152]